MKTKLTIQEDHFLINGRKTYSELPKCVPIYHGLLMNARFIQGVFDDKENASRFNRYGKLFDPEKNTDELISRKNNNFIPECKLFYLFYLYTYGRIHL